MEDDHIPDRLYDRLFRPWALPASVWPLCKEDWQRVYAVCAHPWAGDVLDVGSGDGTLAALVCSRNPLVGRMTCVEPDGAQRARGLLRWAGWPITWLAELPEAVASPFDGLLCCEVLEHVSRATGIDLLTRAVRLCRPGARVCVTTPDSTGSRAVFPGHRVITGDVHEMLTAAGVNIGERHQIPLVGAPIWQMEVGFVA
jgi:SAM-dependent methyltransferase